MQRSQKPQLIPLPSCVFVSLSSFSSSALLIQMSRRKDTISTSPWSQTGTSIPTSPSEIIKVTLRNVFHLHAPSATGRGGSWIYGRGERRARTCPGQGQYLTGSLDEIEPQTQLSYVLLCGLQLSENQIFQTNTCFYTLLIFKCIFVFIYCDVYMNFGAVSSSYPDN